jgi:hypothetical protein
VAFGGGRLHLPAELTQPLLIHTCTDPHQVTPDPDILLKMGSNTVSPAPHADSPQGHLPLPSVQLLLINNSKSPTPA